MAAQTYVMGSPFDTAEDRLDAWTRATRLHEMADDERRAAAAAGFGSDRAAAFDKEARALRDAVRAYYATSKFSDPLAEVADAYICDGFVSAEVGTVEHGGSHYAYLTVQEATTDRQAVIIRTDSDGFVWTHWYGNVHDGGGPRQWAAIVAEHDAAEAEAD